KRFKYIFLTGLKKLHKNNRLNKYENKKYFQSLTVNKKLKELSDNPFLGEILGNKYNINLTGFYKLYINNKKYRIIYRLINDNIEIIEIWEIGKRNKEEIYRLIGKRIKKKTSNIIN
ncbi:MAG: type II toxin-antitoxin system RelE/ParE family toxin, partial [Spirochaetes bacterium]|nr:type II toxin-antitoxin system RelE/ParE family toxin [Spirochaetota bacterium]